MDEAFPILIADDDENDVIILERALRQVGFKNPFHVCRDGAEVLDYLCARGQYADRERYLFPRLLITDIKMPKVTGMQVLKWLHEHPHCNVVPRIVFSASNHPTDVQEAYQWGANSYFVKPGSYQELVKLLKLIFDYWEACERPRLPVKC